MIVFVAMVLKPLEGQAVDPSRVQTPEPIVVLLDSLYPGAKHVEWSKRKRQYTADFIYNGLNVSITFDHDGNLINSVEEVSYDALPYPIQEKIKQFYAPYKIVMITRRGKGRKIDYDVEVIQGKNHYILNYHPRGYLIHQYDVYKVDSSEASMW